MAKDELGRMAGSFFADHDARAPGFCTSDLIGVHNTLVFFGQTHWRNIVFHVFQMYAKMARRDVLAVDVHSPAYATQAAGIVPALANVPYLDVGAYRTPDGKQLALFLINCDVRRSAVVKLDLGPLPWCTQSTTTLTADSYKADNGPSQPSNVVPVTKQAPDLGSIEVPRHSLVRVDYGLK